MISTEIVREGACISPVVLVLNIVVIFRKTGHLEETITTILVLKRRNMMTLLPSSEFAEQAIEYAMEL